MGGLVPRNDPILDGAEPGNVCHLARDGRTSRSGRPELVEHSAAQPSARHPPGLSFGPTSGWQHDRDGKMKVADRTRDELVAVLRRRLGITEGKKATALADSYLKGVTQHALARTIGGVAAPTSMTVDRAELIMAVCRVRGDLLTEREIEALLRVTGPVARSIRRQVEASYDDEVSEYLLGAALRGALSDGTGKFGSVDGNRIVMRDEDARDQLLAECERRGIPAIARPDDPQKPNLVYVNKTLSIAPYELLKWSKG